MAKAILLVRVSTTKQEIETQKKELIQLATQDKFSEKNLIIIEGVGASAIKLNDIYLKEIEELKTTIENNPDIKAVYAWEISRLGRNEEILFNLKNFFIEHGVQLVIKTPSLRLMNPDGTVNNGVELAFSLYATLSKQEMQVKQERMKRGKQRNKLEGKFNGGLVKLGYSLDSNNHFIEHPVNADIVRNCFHLYVEEGKTLKYIHQYLIDNNASFETIKHNNKGTRARRILQDIAYTGVGYPQLVTQEMYDKAQVRIQYNKAMRDTKNVYFCKGILRDEETNSILSPVGGVGIYQCNQPNVKINLNAMDSIAWYYAQILQGIYSKRDTAKTKAEYEVKISENNKSIGSKQTQIDALQKTIQRAIRINIERPEHYTDDMLNSTIEEKERDIAQLKRQITDLELENVRMTNFVNGTEKALNVFAENPSDIKKKEIIDSVIEKIQVTKLARGKYKLTVVNKIGYRDTSHFIYEHSGKRTTLLHVMHNGSSISIPVLHRFDRKRYEK